MNKTTLLHKIIVLLAVTTYGIGVFALPQNGQVAGGSISISNSPNTVNINQGTQKGIINWNSYNVGQGETVNYHQPNSSSITLNRINPQQGASQIYGNINANGHVWLVNPAGIYIGSTAFINVGGIIATTANITDDDFMNGNYRFTRDGNYNGAIVNDGSINAADEGLVALIGNGVVNNGKIVVKLGKVALASGGDYVLDFTGDQLVNFAVGSASDSYATDKDGNRLTSAVSNSGQVIADGGKVMITAKSARQVLDNTINMSGVVEAKTVGVKNGVIILGAEGGTVYVSGKVKATARGTGGKGGNVTITGSRVALADGAEVDVSGDNGGGQVLFGGDYQGKNPNVENASMSYVDPNAIIRANGLTNGDGGRVIVWSDDITRFYGQIEANGGALSGNGGFIETSGKNYLYALGEAHAYAPNGTGGKWLLDPINVNIANAAFSNAAQFGNYFQPINNSSPTSTINVNVINNYLETAPAGTEIIVTTTPNNTGGVDPGAAGNITISDMIYSPTAGGALYHLLTMYAANDIIMTGAGGITRYNSALGITLSAGGQIIVGGTGIVQTSTGTVYLSAGTGIQVTANSYMVGAGILITASGDISIANGISWVSQSGVLAQAPAGSIIMGSNSSFQGPGVTLYANDMTIDPTATVTAVGGGNNSAVAIDTNGSIGINDPAGNLHLSTAELNTIHTNELRIGSTTNTQNITIGSTVFNSGVTTGSIILSSALASGTAITQTGAFSAPSTAGFIIQTPGAGASLGLSNSVNRFAASIGNGTLTLNAGSSALSIESLATGVGTFTGILANGGVSLLTSNTLAINQNITTLNNNISLIGSSGLTIAPSVIVSSINGGASSATTTLNAGTGSLTLGDNAQVLVGDSTGSVGTLNLVGDNVVLGNSTQLGGTGTGTGLVNALYIKPGTLSTSIGLGTGATGTLGLSQTELNSMRSVNSTIGRVSTDGIGNIMTGNVQFGDFVKASNFASSGFLALNTSGSITQAAATAIDLITNNAATFITRGASSVSLTNTGNIFSTIANSSVGSYALTSSQGLIINSLNDGLGSIAGITSSSGSASLTAATQIQQLANVTAPAGITYTLTGSGSGLSLGAGISSTASAGSIVANLNNNAFNMSSGSFSTGGSGTVSINNAGTSTLGNISSGTGSNAITLSTTQAVTQTAGTSLVGGLLTVTTLNNSPANITLTNTGNNLATINLSTRNAANSANVAGTINYLDTNGFDVSGINTTGAITLNAGGAITDSGAITGSLLTTTSVGGTTLDFGHTVSSFNATNTSSGNIALVNTTPTLTVTGLQSVANASITNTGGIVIGGATSNIGGALTLSGSTGITDSTGNLVVTGLTTLNSSAGAITLNTNTNNFNTVVFNSSGIFTLVDTNAVSFGPTASTAAAIIVTAGGDITQSVGGTLSTIGDSSFNAGSNDVILSANNTFNTVGFTARNATINTTFILDFGPTILTGNLIATAGTTISDFPGAILSVQGTASFTVPAFADVGIDSNPFFYGAVSASGSIIRIINNAALPLLIGNITSSNNGTILLRGAGISQVPGTAIVQNASTTNTLQFNISSPNSDLILDQANIIRGTSSITNIANVRDFTYRNAFSGASAFSSLAGATSLRNVAFIYDNAALAIPNLSTTASGTLTATAGGAITDAAGAAIVVQGQTTLNSGSSITLDNSNNDFSTVSVTSATDVTLNDINAINLGAFSLTGNLNITSNGNITQSSPLLVTTGTSTFAAGAGNSVILSGANDFATVVLSNGLNATISDINGLIFGTSTITGTLTASANGSLSQSGGLTANSLAVNNTGGATSFINAGNSIDSLGTINAGTQTFSLVDNIASGLTQTGILTANSLVLTNTAGTTNLSSQNNLISSLGAINASGQDFYLRNAVTGNFTQTGIMQAAQFALTSTGNSNVNLNQNNAVGVLAANLTNSGNTFAFRNAPVSNSSLTIGTVNGIVGISVAGSANISLTNANGSILQTAAITGGLLTTVSTDGTLLNTVTNNVSGFNATNSGTGDVALLTSVPSLAVTGIQNPVGAISVSNTGGNSVYTGIIDPPGDVLLDSAGFIDASGAAIDASGTLTLNTGYGGVVGGALLTNAGNTISNLTATNVTSGDIDIVNTLPLNIVAPGISQSGGGLVRINNTGAVSVNANVDSGGGVTQIISTASITLNGGTITSAAPATTVSNPAILLVGTQFTNLTGSSALNLTGGGYFQVWSGDPASDNRGGLTYDYKQYNAVYGVAIPAQAGNGFLYSIAPVITPSLTGTVTKVYDGNTTATLTSGNYSFTGNIDGDTVTINNPTSGNYDTANAGTGKTVTVNGVSILTSTDGAIPVYGYQLSSSTISGPIGTITAKLISVASTTITANDKVYDGNTSATLNPGTATLSGVVGADVVTVDTTSVTGSFLDPNAGINKTVDVTGMLLTGADAGNYQLAPINTTLLADITPKTLTIGTTTITANDKVYDGNTSATLNPGTATLSGVVGADVVTVDTTSVTGSFLDANAGINKTVDVTGMILGGTDAGNYQLAPVNTTLLADITPKTLTIGSTTITANDKVYDGNTTATLNPGTATLSGIVGADVVTVDTTGVVGSFLDPNAGINKTVDVTGMLLGGADAGNYQLAPVNTSLLADITPKTLTIGSTTITANDKVYDGNTTATLNPGTATLSGIVGADVVTVDTTGVVGSFLDPNAGINKTVDVTGMLLGGADAGNYQLAPVNTSLLADITPKTLTIGSTTITANDKVYDGNTTATLNPGTATLSGIVGADVVTVDTTGVVGSFLDPNAGINKTVDVTGMLLGGADAGNYQLAPVNTSLLADITPKTLTIGSTTITANDKVYDGNTSATLNPGTVSLSGVVGGDTVTVDTSGITGSFLDPNAGVNKSVDVTGMILGGIDASNYQINPINTTLLADITPKTLSVISSTITANNKVYDGTTTASVNPGTASLAGVIGGDVVTLNTSGVTGAFTDKNVGVNKLVNLSGMSLLGADASNYQLPVVNTTTNATITPASLTLGNNIAQNRPYNGTTTAYLNTSAAQFQGLMSGDGVSIGNYQASFAYPAAGNSIVPVSINSIQLSGPDGGNYVLTGWTPQSAYIYYANESSNVVVPPNILYPVYYPLDTPQFNTVSRISIDASAMDKAYEDFLHRLKINPYCSQY